MGGWQGLGALLAPSTLQYPRPLVAEAQLSEEKQELQPASGNDELDPEASDGEGAWRTGPVGGGLHEPRASLDICATRLRVLGRCSSAHRGQSACLCLCPHPGPRDPGTAGDHWVHPAPAPHLLQLLKDPVRHTSLTHSLYPASPQ